MASLLELSKEKLNSNKSVPNNKTLQTADEVLSKINVVNTALKDFPVLFQTTLNKLGEGVNGNFSFNFFFQLLKLMGITEEEFLEWLSSLLCDVHGNGLLPSIEIAIKAILMANFKNLFTCSMTPFIPDKLMDPNHGIELNLTNLDLYGLLSKCPTDKEEKEIVVSKSSILGKDTSTTTKTKGTSIFYFDTDEYTPSTVERSCDFNAFLWYAVNKGSEFAHVWDNRVKYYGKDNGFNNDDFKSAFFNASADPEKGASTITFEFDGQKYSKKEILYCQYREVSPNNIAGSNVIKVWLNPLRYKKTRTIIKKDTFDFLTLKEEKKGKKSEMLPTNLKTWEEYTKNYKLEKLNIVRAGRISSNILNEEITAEKGDFLVLVGNNVGAISESAIKKGVLEGTIPIEKLYKCKENELKEGWNSVQNKVVDVYEQERDKLQGRYNGLVEQLNEGLSINKTIFEFNYDFIESLKLFDAKSLAATIIQNFLSFSTNIGLSASIDISEENNIVSSLIKNYVSEMINGDETLTSDDVFYGFGNDKYEEMIESALMNYDGTFHINDKETYTRLDQGMIMEAVNRIGVATTEEEQKEAIKTALRETIKQINEQQKDISITPRLNTEGFDVFNLFTAFANETVTQIVMQALSPKVYFLYMINSIVMGNIEYVWDKSQRGKDDVVFNTKEDFIKNVKNLLKNITKQIKEIILKELYNTVVVYVKEMIIGYIVMLAKEAIKNYKEILLNLLALLAGETVAKYASLGLSAYDTLTALYDNAKTLYENMTASNYGNYSIENVRYADIIPKQEEPE